MRSISRSSLPCSVRCRSNVIGKLLSPFMKNRCSTTWRLSWARHPKVTDLSRLSYPEEVAGIPFMIPVSKHGIRVAYFRQRVDAGKNAKKFAASVS